MHDPCRASTNRPLYLSLSPSRPHLLRCFPFHLYVFSISPTLCPSSLLFSPRGIPVDTDTGGARSTRQRVLNGVQRRQRGGYEKKKKEEKEREPHVTYLLSSSLPPKVFLPFLPPSPPPSSSFKLYNRNEALSDADIASVSSPSPYFRPLLAPL